MANMLKMLDSQGKEEEKTQENTEMNANLPELAAILKRDHP